jgi:hypothetical protein
MNSWNGFKGAARRLDDIDLPRIGHEIGVGEDEIHAFMDVEASGSGFDASGRPKMLFEPHIFYKHLAGAKRDQAVREGLAYPKWKKGAYPPDSYPRLAAALAIDETAALKAASWGLGQILGENHAMVGYDTPQAMVRAFMEDEEHHLAAIVEFLKAAGIDDDLRRHDWLAVARVYNGPRHAEHDYAGRMAKAFAKWSKIRDTPWSPDDDAPQPSVRELIPAQVKGIQSRLRDLGYFEVGRIDGDFGSRTRDALNSFRADNGLPESDLLGLIDEPTAAALSTASPRPVAPERANAGPHAVANFETVKAAKSVEKAAIGVAGGGVVAFTKVSGLVDQAEEWVGLGGRLNEILQVGLPVLALAAIACGGYMLWRSRKIPKAALAAYRSGEVS